MTEVEIEWPWQYSFPPFFTLQPHAETRERQICAWKNLVLDYFRAARQYTLDIREATRFPVFNNISINRKIDTEFLITILSELQRTGNAAPIDKQRNRWEIYWHTLEEWATIIYNYINTRGCTNAVLTLFEITEGEDVADEDFCGIDTDVLIKVLRVLENQGKCELILADDQQGKLYSQKKIIILGPQIKLENNGQDANFGSSDNTS